MDFAVSAIGEAEARGKVVFEAGAFDVNGSVRPHVESLGPASYTGTDMQSGPRVDVVLDAADLPSLGQADLVLSFEMLEHCADWRAAMRGLIGTVAEGGFLVLTTRSPGFGYHPFPEDHWRFPVPVMGAIIAAAGLEVLRLEADPMPGVFVKARKPEGWEWPDKVAAMWAAAEVAPAR